MARLSPLDPSRFTPGQQTLVGTRPDRARRGPYLVWLKRPELAERMHAVLELVRKLDIPKRTYEMTILLCARDWKAQFAWWAHADIAVREGLDRKVVEDIRDGRKPVFADPTDAAVYRIVTELLAERRLSDETYAFSVETLGENTTIDLDNLVGAYLMVAINLSTFEVDLPDGSPPPLR